MTMRGRSEQVSEPSSWAGALVEVRAMQVRLGGVPVLDGIDLTVEPGVWLGVVGPNGAGKSTLMRALAGLARHSGTVLVDGRTVRSLGQRERARVIGFAPQVPLLPENLTVGDYVLLGRTPHHSLLSGPSLADREIAAWAVARLDLEPLARRPLRALSGGERQRAVLARALAQQPRLLLLDEPTAALDLGHAQQVLEMVDSVRQEERITVVSTLHDLVLAGQYATSLAMLVGGRLVARGRPDQVLTEQALAEHYGARAQVVAGVGGLQVHPVRPR